MAQTQRRPVRQPRVVPQGPQPSATSRLVAGREVGQCQLCHRWGAHYDAEDRFYGDQGTLKSMKAHLACFRVWLNARRARMIHQDANGHGVDGTKIHRASPTQR